VSRILHIFMDVLLDENADRIGTDA
jgi:hypothetical protein